VVVMVVVVVVEEEEEEGEWVQIYLPRSFISSG